MARLIDRPDWRACLSIIREEAAKASVDPQDVIMHSRESAIIACRRASIRRIIAETGCTAPGLSAVWGVGVEAIRAALQEVRPPRKIRHGGGAQPLPDPAPERLRRRLCWLYGEARATQILNGNCPKTQADLAAWKNLGSRRAA